jgi:hypothetical protein
LKYERSSASSVKDLVMILVRRLNSVKTAQAETTLAANPTRPKSEGTNNRARTTVRTKDVT